LAKLFDLEEPGHMYSRISNPTVACVESKIADLEGGVGALCTSSGQAATLIAVLNITEAGDNVVCMNDVYGGTTNLLAVTLKKLGIETRFISSEMTDLQISTCFDTHTRLLFGETLSNPDLVVLDIERFATIAHGHGVPLIVDNTFATPILCNPFHWGADIVIHSTTKYMDGHATVVGGVVVDSGNFDWEKDGRFPQLSQPDPSYHGVVYTSKFGKEAYIVKARTQLLRDLGCSPQPTAAFLLNLGLETLHLRMPRHCENAFAVATFLQTCPQIESVDYPGLKESKDYRLAQKYLRGGMAGGVVSFVMAGGRKAATVFMDSLELAEIVVHVADARTSVLHPASTTHRQLTDEQLEAAGISPGFIRLSVGIEDIDDIIADLRQALDKVATCR
jgi:O-acetylhomoserine (thiol)-lyase